MFLNFFKKLGRSLIIGVVSLAWSVIIAYHQVWFAEISQQVGKGIFFLLNWWFHFDRMAAIAWLTTTNMISRDVTFGLFVAASVLIFDLLLLRPKKQEALKK
jgi:hypothetical protein